MRYNTLAFFFYGVVSRVKMHLVIRSIRSARPTAPLASPAIPNHTTEVFLYLYRRHDLVALEEFRTKKSIPLNYSIFSLFHRAF